MAKKRSASNPPKRSRTAGATASQPASSSPSSERPAVTADRFLRLCRFLRFLSIRARTRPQLLKHLKVDVRGFYRDLELVRTAGVPIELTEGRYALTESVEEALARLPFPDPRLTLGEAQQLARGRTRTHTQLQDVIARLLG